MDFLKAEIEALQNKGKKRRNGNDSASSGSSGDDSDSSSSSSSSSSDSSDSESDHGRRRKRSKNNNGSANNKDRKKKEEKRRKKKAKKTKKKKYLTRREMEELEEAEREKERRERIRKEGRHTHHAESDSEKGSSDDEDMESSSKRLNLSAVEVKKRLRNARQPITLYGETDDMRLKRLRKMELAQLEMNDGAKGSAADFQRIMQQEVEDELRKATENALEAEKIGDDGKTDSQRAKEKVQKRVSKYAEKREKDSFKHKENYILFFFKRMLLEWENQLAERPDEEKRTTRGKVASATQKQTRNNLKPLIRLLKAKKAEKDILRRVEKIVDKCLEREYVEANEEYMMLAIGNSAWPMGVTMVGIHERAGREKIFSQSVAHVLNNEEQRKYVQALKRIMTFCQTKYPNVPSKMVRV